MQFYLSLWHTPQGCSKYCFKITWDCSCLCHSDSNWIHKYNYFILPTIVKGGSFVWFCFKIMYNYNHATHWFHRCLIKFYNQFLGTFFKFVLLLCIFSWFPSQIYKMYIQRSRCKFYLSRLAVSFDLFNTFLKISFYGSFLH